MRISDWSSDVCSSDLFKDNILVPPTETFERELALKVGDKDVHLFNVGPAHTTGDTVIHSVQDRTVYTGDLLFIDVHPAIWEGSLDGRSEEHTSELQSLMRISYAVFCLQKQRIPLT